MSFLKVEVLKRCGSYISQVKVMVSKVSNLETSTWQQRSIARSNIGFKFESRWSNVIWLATVEHRRSCDTISFVKLTCGVLLYIKPLKAYVGHFILKLICNFENPNENPNLQTVLQSDTVNSSQSSFSRWEFTISFVISNLEIKFGVKLPAITWNFDFTRARFMCFEPNWELWVKMLPKKICMHAPKENFKN